MNMYDIALYCYTLRVNHEFVRLSILWNINENMSGIILWA